GGGGTRGQAAVAGGVVGGGLGGWGGVARRGDGTLVRVPAGRSARLPGGQVPPARGCHAPRPAPPVPPGPTRRRGEPGARRLGRARSPVRVDRAWRPDRGTAGAGRGLRPGTRGGDAA